MKNLEHDDRRPPHKEGEPCTFGRTKHFGKWLKDLDKTVKVLLTLEIAEAEGGKPGKRMKGTNGIYELVLDVGPGYRLYYYQVEGPDYMLLTGGTKDSQRKDIARAMKMRDAEEEARGGRKH